MTAGAAEAALSYLARDYQGVRQALLEEIGVALGAVPDDAGSVEMALVEVLAYLADYHSYHQDAVATEAYLATARQRLSVVRHARLLGYRVDPGCAARVWVHVATDAERLHLPAGTAFVTRIPGLASPLASPSDLTDDREVFEAMHGQILSGTRNRLLLAAPPAPGATSLAMAAAALGHAPGDVLVLQHLATGWAHPVRLTEVLEDTARWHPGDALPEHAPRDGAWALLGNMVLADHGRSTTRLHKAPLGPKGEIDLPGVELSYAAPYDHRAAQLGPAAAAAGAGVSQPVPSIAAAEHWPGACHAPPRAVWTGAADLIDAGPDSRRFAVDPLGPDHVRLRFGDGRNGRCPPGGGIQYHLRFRIGRGRRGNVGPATIVHTSHDDPRIRAVLNPLPATGGRDPEPIEQARRAAVVRGHDCGARCVTMDDYADAAANYPGVLAASARRDAQGDRSRVLLAIVRNGWATLDDRFGEDLAAFIAPRAMIGDFLQVEAAAVLAPRIRVAIAPAPGMSMRRLVPLVRQQLVSRKLPGFGEPLRAADLDAFLRAIPGVSEARSRVEPPAAPAAHEIVRIDPERLQVVALE